MDNHPSRRVTLACMSADDRFRGCAELTKHQRTVRDARVFADRRRGLSWAAIEQRHGVSERHGRRIVDRMADRRPSIEVDPDEAVRELFAHWEQAIEDLALLVDSPNDSVRVAAITRRVDLVERRVLTLRELGLLPRDWGGWAQAVESVHIAERLVEVLRRRDDVPLDVLAELVAELEQIPPRLTRTSTGDSA